MKDFRRPSGQSAGRSGGYDKREQGGESRPPRPSYDNRGGYNKYSPQRDSGERREMLHKATCSECNNTCEVPFRPNGSKPVYCKDCFGKKKGAYEGNAPKKEFAPRAPEVRVQQSQASESRDPRIDDLKAQIFSMQSKLDRILKVMEGTVAPAPVATPAKVEKKAEKKAVPAAKKPTAKVAVKAAPKAKPVAKKKK
jgi:CxxC-x17-CxxC domain-containing protein